MSTLKVLKEYVLGDGGYLLNDANNGKTVMLYGAWGSGKTHFWQNEIENDLTEKLKKKNKACVYVSLYGKDNIEAIKNEILFKAYESIKDENKLAKRAISAFGFSSRLLSVSIAGVRANTGAVGDAVEGFFESKKIDEAESFLADGGLVCLDDFERKSKHIDLNDLFGFISQLAIDMNCKIVIILNSDVFEGEEANVFKTVKEKTVNKFFYFNPTIKELFNSIYESNEKYNKLDKYKNEILKAIKETEELNARIYIQVLDNCLEWIEKDYDGNVLKGLIFTTMYFLKTHNVLKYAYINVEGEEQYYEIQYNMYNFYPEGIFKALKNIHIMESVKYSDEDEDEDEDEYFISIKGYIDKLNKLDGDYIISEIGRKILGDKNYSEVSKQTYLDYLYKNENQIREFWKYGYRLYYMDTVDETTYNKIANFVKNDEKILS